MTARYVLDTAKHPKIFADHIVSSISRIEINKDDKDISNADINEA